MTIYLIELECGCTVGIKAGNAVRMMWQLEMLTGARRYTRIIKTIKV